MKKVLTIQVSVTLSERKNGAKRLQRACERAAARAVEILDEELVSGSVDSVDTSWDYSYNVLTGNQSLEMVVENDEEDAEDEDL